MVVHNDGCDDDSWLVITGQPGEHNHNYHTYYNT